MQEVERSHRSSSGSIIGVEEEILEAIANLSVEESQ